jgi:hypothetical protein
MWLTDFADLKRHRVDARQNEPFVGVDEPLHRLGRQAGANSLVITTQHGPQEIISNASGRVARRWRLDAGRIASSSCVPSSSSTLAAACDDHQANQTGAKRCFNAPHRSTPKFENTGRELPVPIKFGDSTPARRRRSFPNPFEPVNSAYGGRPAARLSADE